MTEIPWLLSTTPYSVQVEAIRRAAGRVGFYWHMDMGLGKTQVAFNEYLIARRRGAVDSLLVICPNYLKHNWVREAETCGFPFPLTAWPKTSDHVVLNYESTLHSGGDYIYGHLARHRTYLVLDESSAVANYQAKRTKRITAFGRRAVVRRCLSGTGATEGPDRIWTQLNFLGASLFPYSRFRVTFCNMGGYLGRKAVGIREGLEEAYGEQVGRYMFIAKKEDWLDLPEKTYNIRRGEMTPGQVRVYEDLRRTLVAEIDDGVRVTTPYAVTALLRLQQIASGFTKSDDGDVRSLVAREDNPKINLLLGTLGEVRDKVVVFCHFIVSINMIEEALRDAGIPHRVVYGATDQASRETFKAAFNEDDDVKVIVYMDSVGARGHTLLGTLDRPCHDVIFYESSYSLETRLQCEDRVHRIGQRWPVTYTSLTLSGIEEKIARVLDGKKNLFEQFIHVVRAGS
jgi:SNF2 family DNA or RNA helicase